ncbi:PorP/SprF family type IX secretion system membrane protein [Ferruginibacter sp. HRS2-29]|uniref:PorP/SprF family type IX secretion system membrane protein n=1 Tax=Ferruginibacter sp. HRS2-29 TaxID=2487334 RepID=UPI0020CDA7EE|nr:PorP/SprF family type IX secretion system membrane protein [Ferruginibacter sp. HRS2-29]
MKYYFLSIGLLLFACVGKTQDINFSQFYEMPLLRNPALAGLYSGDFRATAAFRSQWNSVTTPYQTQGLGVELKFSTSQQSDNYLALGLQMTNDIAGDSKLGKTQLLPVLTYHHALSDDNDTYVSAGFMAGPVQQRFDATKLSFDDQFVNGSYSNTNPTRQVFTRSNVTYLDASVGFLVSTSFANDVKCYAGGSWFHFNNPKVAFEPNRDVLLNNKFMINAGLSAPLSEYHRLILYADYFKQGGNNQMQGGFLYKRDLLQMDEDETISLSAGSFLRWNDAVIPVLKLDYYELGVGLTYDVNISKLRAASQSRGGFEITVSYRNFLNMRNSSLDKTRCPRF